jgi:major cell surface glycoprotein (TIGR04216 family)
MVDQNHEIGAVVLTAMVVFSIFAGTVAFAGTETAATTETLDASTINRATGASTAKQAVVFDRTLEGGTNSLADSPYRSTVVQSVSSSLSSGDSDVLIGNPRSSGSDYVNSPIAFTNTVDTEPSDYGVQASLTTPRGLSHEKSGHNGFSDVSRSINSGGTVYLGEEDVNLTALSGVSAGNPATFTGVSGDADGSVASVSDGAAADITSVNNFEPGGYDSPTASGGGAELFVAEPQITGMTIYSGVGTEGADVTNGSITTDTDIITVESEWTFDDSEAVDITIEDEDGINVQPQVSGSASINTSGQWTAITGLSELDTGEYVVTVEGQGNLDTASRSATFTIRDESQSISLSEPTVTRGEDTVATVTGSPGTYGLIRIDSDDVDNLPEGIEANSDASAEEVFPSTGDIESRRGAATVGATERDYIGAVVDLGDEGEARIRIDTDSLDTSAINIEFVELGEASTNSSNIAAGFDADPDDDIELGIKEKTVNIVSAPNVVRVGEDFEVEATAAESSEVAAYARIDNRWELLSGDENPVEVRSDGVVVLELTASRPINLPDNYRIAIVTQEAQGIGEADADTFPAAFDSAEFGDLDVKETLSLRTVESDLTAQLSSQSVAANVDDDVTVSGIAPGQRDEVRVYRISPRGDVQFESADIDEGEFEVDISDISQRGTHTFIVVGEGQDGNYAATEAEVNNELSGDETPQQAIAIINDLYTGAGVDDQVVELTLQAETPLLTIDDFDTDGRVAQDEVTVAGTSNRENGTVVFIEVIGDDLSVIASDKAEVNGSTGEWSTTIDMSDVETGTYTLRADDDETADSLKFRLVESVTKPAEVQTQEPTTEANEQQTESTEQPTEATLTSGSTETTSTSTPGFGVVMTFIALIAGALLAVRRD